MDEDEPKLSLRDWIIITPIGLALLAGLFFGIIELQAHLQINWLDHTTPRNSQDAEQCSIEAHYDSGNGTVSQVYQCQN
jgi:hypothetical protein